jgi:aryl-alcohol dehydrogenase-like predicted oxidoreductase
MRYKLLGSSGLRVSELALGTMTFGETWGWGASKEESRKIFDAFAEAGGNFVDTANNYTDGTSEEFVGDFVAADREHFVVATKYTLSTRRDDPNAGGNHRKNMVQALEASLRRLRTDYVDLLWLHMWDGLTPVEEILRAFDDLVRAGKVLYVGFSDTPAWVVSRAHAIATVRGWTPPVAVQLPLSLADRGAQRDLLPMADQLDLAVCAWGTLEGGTLTGKYFSEDGGPRRYSGDPGETEQKLAREVMAVAQEAGCTPAQVAVNWVRQQPGLVIPIIGARTEEQARDNLACLDHELSEEQLDRLTQAAPISLGFPHSFLGSEHVTGLIFGETRPLIDTHRAVA